VREIITVVKLRSDRRLGFRRNWIAGKLNVGATRSSTRTPSAAQLDEGAALSWMLCSERDWMDVIKNSVWMNWRWPT